MLRYTPLHLIFLLAFPGILNFSFSVKQPNADFHYSAFSDSSGSVIEKHEKASSEEDIYSQLKLDKKGLSKNAFELALKGYHSLLDKRMIRNKNIISIADFSKSSNEKRFFVIDLKRIKLLFQTLVAHGRNSGLEYATSFSNEDDSHKSSLGFYVTMNTYTGDCGYALKLKGCEKGINDHAYDRAIVVHGSQYVTDEFLRNHGFLGRSWGCPALPDKISKKVIDVIRNGSCFFIYHPTEKYLTTSPVLKDKQQQNGT